MLNGSFCAVVSEIKLYERIAALERQIKEQTEMLSHRDITSQVLQDELQALQLELLSREEKMKDLERDNKSVLPNPFFFSFEVEKNTDHFLFFSFFLFFQLLERWLQRLNEEAARMNTQNEQLEV